MLLLFACCSLCLCFVCGRLSAVGGGLCDGDKVCYIYLYACRSVGFFVDLRVFRVFMLGLSACSLICSVLCLILGRVRSNL